MGKFWTSRRALTEGLIPFAVEAFNTFLPFCKPVTSPISAWPVAAGRKALVTSAPFALTWTPVKGTSAGTSTLTSTSPPLTRSGAVESVVITREGESANPGVAMSRANTAMPASRNRRVFIGDLLVVWDVRAAPARGRAVASDSSLRPLLSRDRVCVRDGHPSNDRRGHPPWGGERPFAPRAQCALETRR